MAGPSCLLDRRGCSYEGGYRQIVYGGARKKGRCGPLVGEKTAKAAVLTVYMVPVCPVPLNKIGHEHRPWRLALAAAFLAGRLAQHPA